MSSTAADKVGTQPVAPVSRQQLERVIKAYDVRGLCPSELTADVARAIGAAFATYCGAPRVVVGRDVRTTSTMVFDAFASGCMAVGAHVTDLGPASTDLLYFASGQLDAPGAMITASHNPPEFNGIKLCRAGALPLGIDSGLAEISEMAAAGSASNRGGHTDSSHPPNGTATRGTVTQLDMLEPFAQHVVSFIDPAFTRGLRVVADTANGMGGLVLPAVFAHLPCELEVLYGELDGTFPNHPADPLQPENLVDLQAAVTRTGADVGLAFDGDADRVFVVDEAGGSVSGSLLTALVAQAVLKADGPAPILHNLICSRAVPEVITEHGGTPVRTRVGHSYMKAVMAETGAPFGGEHSGHYYFKRNYRADSGLIAAVTLLAQLGAAGRPLSELLAPLDRYAASGEINTAVADPGASIEAVAERFTSYPTDRLDGLSVDCGDWWFNLRPSNTEPLLRLNLEAADKGTVATRTDDLLTLLTGGADSGEPNSTAPDDPARQL